MYSIEWHLQPAKGARSIHSFIGFKGSSRRIPLSWALLCELIQTARQYHLARYGSLHPASTAVLITEPYFAIQAVVCALKVWMA
jgi:hypothetical protein